MRVAMKCRFAAGAAAVSLFAASAHAADPVKDYPLRPVRIVSGYTAGGSTDFLFRVLAPKLTERLGQPFIIDYRPGGSGTIGASLVAKATPEFQPAARFFKRFRDLTAGGFYTTPEGMKDIGYTGNVPLPEFAGPPPEVLAKLGLA